MTMIYSPWSGPVSINVPEDEEDIIDDTEDELIDLDTEEE